MGLKIRVTVIMRKKEGLSNTVRKECSLANNTVITHPYGVKPIGNKYFANDDIREESLGLLSCFRDEWLLEAVFPCVRCCTKVLNPQRFGCERSCFSGFYQQVLVCFCICGSSLERLVLG